MSNGAHELVKSCMISYLGLAGLDELHTMFCDDAHQLRKDIASSDHGYTILGRFMLMIDDETPPNDISFCLHTLKEWKAPINMPTSLIPDGGFVGTPIDWAIHFNCDPIVLRTLIDIGCTYPCLRKNKFIEAYIDAKILCRNAVLQVCLLGKRKQFGIAKDVWLMIAKLVLISYGDTSVWVSSKTTRAQRKRIRK